MDACGSIYWWGRTHNTSSSIFKIFYKSDKKDNKNFELNEPFKGLFTQGMVCHETYKDEKNNWVSPDEVFTENGKDFYVKDQPKIKIKVGPSESMSKSKKYYRSRKND